MRAMEGKRREPVEGEAETPSKMKIGLGQLERSTEINHNQSESFTVPVENHVTLSGVARMDNELVNSFSSETLSLKSELMNKPTEEQFHSKEDATCLRSMGKTEGDPLKYTLTRETESAMLEVKMQSCTQAYCDEILGKYQGLPEGTPEEAIYAYLPQVQLHSYNINFPSSLMTQHRNSVLSVGTTPPEGAVNTNVDKIPVLRPLLTPNSSVNNCVSCGQIKGITNNSPESQPLSGSFGEPCNGISTLPQDSASVCDESAEVREAVVSITTNSSEEAVFQNSDGETSHNLAVSQNAVEQPTCSHRNYSNPQVIICQLKGGTHILCINNTDTRELKAVHLVPQHQEQLKYFQPEANNSVTSILGQFLPLEGKLNVCAQELDKGSMHTCHPDANLQEQTKMTLLGIPCSSWDAKSKKPCNCTKSQCLKLYCDCFANGDFCSNCNCNNCYNNPQHEIERFKAIKACLDRNPEAFLPKIGKGKLGDIKPRHNKGCNCKRSGCLKNYCECFEAKIMCSSICKCVGCKNYEESPDRKTLMNMPNHMESKSNEGNDSLSFSNFEILSKNRKDRQSSTCISWEVVEATCACLLAQAEEAEKEAYSVFLAERMILEEFGRCLSQILHSEFKSKGLKVD